ncbi:MAG: disulfide bond formation protein DsbB [Parcubacteria bacterium C7867-006]|nr:MAG: disulfide bond formation protein DsbB [Parcubacteria bacterium C7867-006]
MTSFIQANATSTIGFLTLLSNIIFVGVLVVILSHADSRKHLYNFVHKYILELLFFGILSAVVGSLVYSDIVGFLPCDLCWWQRIFMYPQLVIVALALYRKDKSIIDYLVPLSVMGAVLALYQSFVQWGFSFGVTGGCVAVGGECAKVYFTQYSYITIPFMSLTVFVYIIALKFVYYHKSWKLKNGWE